MNNLSTYMNRLIVLLVIFVMGASSAWADTWDGTITSNANNKFAENGITLQTPGQPNSADNPYTIDNAKEFAYFMRIVHEKWTGYSSAYYWKLTTDIDLNNIEWTHGSNTGNTFQGHFDGDGHTIKNVSLSITGASNFGLFPTIQGASATSLAEVKNLNIDGVTFTSTVSRGKTTRLGALTGYAKQANISDINISNVKYSYADITDEHDLGGAIGCTETIVTLDNVTVNGLNATFSGTTTNLYIAGLVGKINSQTTVQNCSTDDVTITYNKIANASRISGFIGYAKGAAGAPTTISSCSVANTTIGLTAGINNASYIGVLLAQGDAGTEISSSNSISTSKIQIDGDVKAATNYIGGAIGNLTGSATVPSKATGVTIDNSDITLGTSSNGIVGVRAGVIGQVSKNVLLKDLTVNGKSKITVNGNLITTETRLGGLIGYLETDTNAPVSISNANISGNSEISVTGKFSKASQLGGLIGYVNPGDKDNAGVSIQGSNISGDVSIQVGGNIEAGSHLGGYIGYVQGRAKSNSSTIIDGVNLKNPNISVGGNITAGSYLGGVAGYVTTSCQFNTVSVDSPAISVNGNIGAASYIGGAIGDFVGGNGFPSTVNTLTVTNPTISVNNYSAGTSLTGGVFGRVSTYTAVDGVDLKGASLTFTNDLSVAQQIGTFAGTITGNATQQISVKNVTIDKSELTFGSSSTSKTVGLKAGVIGQVYNNVLLDTWKVKGNSSVTIKGNLETTASQIGGFIGYAKGAGGAPLDLNKIEIGGKSSVSVSVNVAVGSYIGGVFGQVEQDNADNVKTAISNVEAKDSITITIGGNISGGSYLGGFAGYIYSRNRLKCSSAIEHVTLLSSSVAVKGQITASSYVGGLIGRVGNASCKLNDCNIKTESAVSIGDITTASSYIGGAIGQIDGNAGYNAGIDGITIKKTAVTVNKVTNKDCYIGGVFGRINTYCDVIKNVSVNNPTVTYKYTDNPNVALNIGSFAGGIFGHATQKLDITDITVDGTAQLTIGEAAKAATTNISNIKAGFIGNSTTHVCYDGWIVNNSDVIINGNLTTSASYIGGFVGYAASAASAPLSIKNITLGSDATKVSITINGNVTYTLYLGGLVGYQTIATLKESSVTGGDITINGNSTTALYIGGAVGWLNPTAAPYATVQQVEVKNTKIHTSGKHTYAKGNKPLVVGGVVGYMGQSATTFTEVRSCVADNVDIDFSGFVPEDANTSGSSYNQQQNAFVIGGVIGRINTPSLLPEHLFYSGKIYAPFAAVAPIVGVFLTNVNNAAYLYDDYSGENAASLTRDEWKKSTTWYYNNYEIGLSSAVTNQTDRTKNYSCDLDEFDGVKYLPVNDKTFLEGNTVSGTAKNSFTVLRYTANNVNEDYGIYPQWNTNAISYPAYYMYFMQGVNRGMYAPDEKLDFIRLLVDNGISFRPRMTRSGDEVNGYVFTVDPGDVGGFDGFTISYQWYQSDKTTSIGDDTNALNLTSTELENVGSRVYCVVTVSGDAFSPVSHILQGGCNNVIFVNGSGYKNHGAGMGIDTNDGMTPQTPVLTINQANSLLDGGSWDKNIIVIMGTLNDDADFRSTGTNPATLTGKWEGIDYEGVIKLKQINAGSTENDVNPVNQSGKKGSNCYVKAATKFENLTFQANSNSDGNNFIECHGNDVWFGKGLSMTNFRNLGEDHGNLGKAQNIPEITIVLIATNLNEKDIQTYTDRTKPQTLTIESGHYGRVLAGRYTNGFFAKADNTSHAILGSPEHPVWAVVNIDIDKENPNKGSVNRHEDPNKGTVIDNYTLDINCIIAGLTDGSMYGDYTINVHGGRIGYIVGGNQGNPVPNGDATFIQTEATSSGKWGQWPNATYFGRTVINVEQNNDLADIIIDNIYAGGLGRKKNGTDASTTVVDMYLYGRTEVNMKSGTVLGNVYAGGAGGVIGLNPWDAHVPYATDAEDKAADAIANKVQYGIFGSAEKTGEDPLTNVTLHNLKVDGSYGTELLDLANSSTTLNISGGIIKGNVFGGGYGYVSNMPVEVTMQGVGSIFGTSNVNISGGTIDGSVYGGSQGHTEYYGKKNNYGQTLNHIAEMNGTVNLNITGTDAKYPTIGGNIYGAGKGVGSSSKEEYLRIATSGNTELGVKYKTNINILIDLPESCEFNGNVYGGGEMGLVDGNTKVVIKGGTINGNVFGAGEGESGHPNKAQVTGDIHVIVGDEQ